MEFLSHKQYRWSKQLENSCRYEINMRNESFETSGYKGTLTVRPNHEEN